MKILQISLSKKLKIFFNWYLQW